MEEFVNQIDRVKFSSTNGEWNRLMLNDPWSVGYVTTLIELQEFQSKYDWEEFYYQKGEERLKKMHSLPESKQKILNDFELIRTNRNLVEGLTWNEKNVNTQFGRTKEEIASKGQVLYNAVKNNGHNLTLDECIECVRFRVICETWNGVIIRERNTINKLQAKYPNLSFRKVDGEKDYKYAVDYEVFNENNLLFALQIKPISYTWNAPYIVNARNRNKIKNEQYTQENNVPVFYIISKTDGQIEKTEVLSLIEKCIADRRGN